MDSLEQVQKKGSSPVTVMMDGSPQYVFTRCGEKGKHEHMTRQSPWVVGMDTVVCHDRSEVLGGDAQVLCSVEGDLWERTGVW